MLVESSVLEEGVNVPDQVMLSLLLIVESVPLGAVISAELVNEITTSEKTIRLSMGRDLGYCSQWRIHPAGLAGVIVLLASFSLYNFHNLQLGKGHNFFICVT